MATKQFKGRHNTAAARRGPTVADRTCLGCQKSFLSEGNWNRLCPECGRISDNDNTPPMGMPHKVALGSRSFQEAGHGA